MIVFIDDDQEILEVLKDYFEEKYEIAVFQDPREALRYIEDNRKIVEVVITDYKMPNINGIDVARRVRQAEDNILVILMSGFVDFENVQDYLKQRLIYQFVNKPFSLERLAQTVDTAVKIYIKKAAL
jgi:DNA-binding NtrC family response regulator